MTSSGTASEAPVPLRVRLYGRLWKIAIGIGGFIVLGLGANLLATWLTSSKGSIPADSPLIWLADRWFIVLSIGVCFLLLALLFRMGSRVPARIAPSSLSLQNRTHMLGRLRRSYRDLLAHSLQGTTWIESGLAQMPDAVQNATNRLVYVSHQTEQLLPPGTSIVRVYDNAEQELLILGEPGAGKSTFLLHLALELVQRAEQEDTRPLPVILPLSSWAEQHMALEDWLREQVALVYDVPHVVATQWVRNEQILPLLDGLDEMDEASRPACIAAINAYHQDHLIPLVICSRRAEYEDAAKQQQLRLQDAVLIQPLTREQVTISLDLIGKPLAALRSALKKNPALQELATTPLMLNVLMLTYWRTSVRELSRNAPLLQKQIWTDYVQRMVERKQKDYARRYSLEQTCSWLSWLAQQMRAHNQSLFYGESLLEDWLPASQHQVVKWLVGRLPAVLLGACASLLLSFFLVGSINPATLCQIGLVGGFLGWCVRADRREKAFTEVQHSWWRGMLEVQGLRLLSAGCLAILVAASFGLGLDGQYYVLSDWVRDGIISSGSILVSAWLLQMVLLRLSPLPILPLVQSASRWAHLSGWLRTTQVRRALWTAMILGVCMTVSYALRVGLSDGLGFGLGLGSGLGLSYALSYGGTIYLVSSILDMQTGTVLLAERISWTWRKLVRFRHLWASLIVALACLCFFGLSAWLSYELEDGFSYGLSGEAITGLSTGLSYGLTIGLSYWVFLGLYQGMTQDHLEEQDRRRFNQGLHQSLRNGLLLSLFGAVIIAGMGILSNGLAFGLDDGLSNGLAAGLNNGLSIGLNNGLSHLMNYGLPVGLTNELRYGWLFLLSGWFILWIATGGLTILRHYTLRLLLARSHTFPWRTQVFLDDATARILLRQVGGGYSFAHQLLLNYFADLDPGPASAQTFQSSPPTPE